MSNPKLSTLSDGFTGSTINTTLWSNITGGTASLDQANDLVVLAQPTTSGATNTFGSNSLYDATSSSIYAEVGPVANGNGHTSTIFKLLVDANNSIAIRLASGVFEVTVQTAGTTVATALAAFDPNAHGWWQLAESGGSFSVLTSADGFNWSTLATLAHSWAATAMMFVFQTSAAATEVSGNVATLQHVNTMTGGSFNINWPVLEDAWAPRWTCNGGDMPLDQYVSINARTQAQSTVTRGKQYELDQCRSGESSGVWQNTDGALDPNNGAGPYFQHIQPYQPWRRRAQWPPTRNLLSQTQATAGDDGGQPLGTINGGSSGPSIFSVADTSGGSFVSTASAWQGSTVMQFAVPSATAANIRIVYTPQVAVVPGATYSLTMQVRNVTPSTSLQVQPIIRSLDPNETILLTIVGTAATLTGSATAGWTTVTVSGIATSAAALMQVGLMTSATAAATCAIQVDGWQLEQAAAPSTWCCPGIWYGIWAGFTEDWAETWDMGGTYGLVTPSGVDAMGLLSQVTLTDPLTQEITANNPRFLYTLGDPEGSGSAADFTGNCQPIYASQSKYGAGSLVFGTAITATSGAAGEYTGSTGSVMTINNPTPGTGAASPASFLSLDSAGITGPANPLSWTRMCAYRYTAGSNPAAEAMMWSGFDQQNGAGSVLHWSLNSAGQFFLTISGPGGAGGFAFAPGAGAHVADGNWHLAIVGYSGAATLMTVCLDGGISTYSIPTADAPAGLVSDNFGAYCDSVVGKGSAFNWQGDFSYVAEFPTALTSTQMTNIYSAWLSACAGESSDQRYARILRYAGYTGNANLQAGLTTDMGPATDISGSDALSCLQAVCDSENGQHFVDVNGTIQFQARSARYNSLTPVYTFGENAAGGEWPYEDAQLSLDPTQISNIVQVTQNSTNQLFTAQDTTSQGDYFPRTLQRTINVNSAVECQAAAYYLVSRYRQPATRVASLVLHPSAMPQMWPVALSLELGMRVQVNRRPPAAPATQVPCFVEAINWSWDDQGEATVTLQASPVDLTAYGIFTSFHTTMHTTASGVNNFTLNSGTDSVNPCAAQIGFGQQLVLGFGTANQETVTVIGVAATSSGWSTCVITISGVTAKSHTSGDTVCEPMPTGITPASYYDSAGVFNACAYSY